MFRWTPYVFIRFTLFLISGILAYWWKPEVAATWAVAVFGVSLLVYFTVWTIVSFKKAKPRLHILFGLLAWLATASFGWLATHRSTAANRATHLLHQTDSVAYYTATVVSEVQVRAKNYRATVEITALLPGETELLQGQPPENAFSPEAGRLFKPACGKVLVYSSKDAPKPAYGDQLLIRGAPQPISKPANPDEFDYRQYLGLQQVHFQQFVKPGGFAVYGHGGGNPIVAASLRVRSWADSVFRHHIRNPQEYAIVTGLVLGIRDGLDNELKNAYAAAGAMHVLAVSGAHVIIVFQLVVLMLGRLKKVRFGGWVFAITALLILWFYAFVTGLSASVLRAVIMFSFVIIGEAVRREGNLFNTLGISAFGLLCYDPYLLQDVGFQLSYLAVAGIVYLHPKLYRWFDFQNWFADKLWEMTCVSLAAQIAVFPLTLFYFHQFPTYFLLANAIVIPVSTAVLYGGLALLAFAWVPYLSGLLAVVLQWITWLLNQCAFLTEQTPGALIQGIHVNVWELTLLYLLTVAVFVFFYQPRLRYWGVAALLLLGVSASQLYGKFRFREQHLLAVYAIPGHATLDVIDNQTHVFVMDSALAANDNRVLFHLRNHWGRRRVLPFQKILFSGNDSTKQNDSPEANANALTFKRMRGYSVFVWHGRRFCILHQAMPLQDFPRQKMDYLIVQNNSLRNIKKLPEKIFGTVILDASNKFYLSKRLKKAFIEKQTACHNVQEDGAFLLEL